MSRLNAARALTLAGLAALGFGLASCGKTGELQRPGPLFGQGRVESPGDAPLVLVAPSTAHDSHNRLVRTALAALADEPVRVVATTNNVVPQQPIEVPGNARLVDWLSYSQVMPQASLVICARMARPRPRPGTPSTPHTTPDPMRASVPVCTEFAALAPAVSSRGQCPMIPRRTSTRRTRAPTSSGDSGRSYIRTSSRLPGRIRSNPPRYKTWRGAGRTPAAGSGSI